MSKAKKLQEFVGIIDTEGLDRFEPISNHSVFTCTLRADSNPQRHACVFVAEFDSKADPVKAIKGMDSPWAMWDYINLAAKNIKCKPQDEKTILNIKQLSKAIEVCTKG